jgi:hypothetical protein
MRCLHDPRTTSSHDEIANPGQFARKVSDVGECCAAPLGRVSTHGTNQRLSNILKKSSQCIRNRGIVICLCGTNLKRWLY